MAMKKNATELAYKYPLAANVVESAFYVDDGLTGAKDIPTAIRLRHQLQHLFEEGGSNLRKWYSSEPDVVGAIPSELRESEEVLSITDAGTGIAKTLGVEWDTKTDCFQISIAWSHIN